MGIAISQTARESAGSSTFDLIPAGKYAATIFAVERATFGGANEGKDYYKVQYRIAEGPHTNRRLFENIPLFTEWGATPKNPEGSVAFTFFTFFEALGFDLSVDDFNEPSPNELGGLPLTITVKQVFSAYRQEKVNEVGGHAVAQAGAGAGGVAGIATGDTAANSLASILGASPAAADSPWKING